MYLVSFYVACSNGMFVYSHVALVIPPVASVNTLSEQCVGLSTCIVICRTKTFLTL